MKQICKGAGLFSVLVWFVILFQVVWITGCISTQSGAAGQVVVDGYLQKEIEAENAHLLPVGLNPVAADIQRARSYWLKEGDDVVPVWDTFELHWQNEGIMCPFANNNSDENCAICDFCALPPNSPGPPCFNASPTFQSDLVKIVVDAGFMRNSPVTVHDFAGNAAGIQGTCANNGLNRPSFAPTVSGIYRFASDLPVVKFPGATPEMPVEETKIHLIGPSNGSIQRAAYQLRPVTIDSKNYWTWTVEGGDFWMENFSSNLRISEIRIFKGNCADGSALGRSCQVPNTAVAVKPSRVLFLPNFGSSVSMHPFESTLRCYSRANAADGSYIDLSSCRQMANTPQNQELSLSAVPTFQYELIGPMNDQFQKLSWFVEFNILESFPSTAENIGTETEFIIEFTIVAD